MKPWLVTGAAGFLGSHVVEELLRRGYPVVAVDNLSGGRKDHLDPFRRDPRFRFEKRDVRNVTLLGELFERERPEAAIHLAALHFIPACEADPAAAESLNVGGTASLLGAARAAGVERVWFASTGDVYAPAEAAHREDSPLGEFSVYGRTKRRGEELVAAEARARPGASFVVGRLFNLYGPRETNPHVLPEILQQLRQRPNGPLRLGNTWPRRDLVPVADAARAAVESLERAPAGLTVVNVATGRASAVDEVIALVGELRGRRLIVEKDPGRVRPVERPVLQADVSRLRGLIGWAPHDDLRRGLEELLREEGLLP